MQDKTPEIPAEARAVAELATDLFGSALLGLDLHGSAVSGGLRPRSDVDLLAVIDGPMTQAMRTRLLDALLRLSGRHPAAPGGPRCIEMVVVPSRLAAPFGPACCEFLYGEWLRERFEAGEPPAPLCDPEITLLLAQARQEARPLSGPPAASLLPEISTGQIRRAMSDALPALFDGLQGDEGNVLLTLARMWRTAATGDFVTKDAAADWAVPFLPDEATPALAFARDGYLGVAGDDWTGRETEARRAAEHLRQRVMALL